MLYYRVKKEYDNKQKINIKSGRNLYHYKNDIWIADELYTPGELQKLKKNGIIVNDNYFDTIAINKNKTYFFFGARFAVK
jgi:hypothetical protein